MSSSNSATPSGSVARSTGSHDGTGDGWTLAVDSGLADGSKDGLGACAADAEVVASTATTTTSTEMIRLRISNPLRPMLLLRGS